MLVGIVIGTMMVTPAGAHVSGNVSHLWSKHIKPLVQGLVYTKAQSDARYARKAESDLEAYCARVAAEPRSYEPGPCDGFAATVDEPGVGWYTSLAIGSDGLPIIAYQDVVNQDVKVVHCGNAACSSGNSVGAALSDGDVGHYTSLAIGSDGLPVIAYLDATQGRIEVVRCLDVGCSAFDEPAAIGGSGWSSLAIGSDGFPIVAYQTHDLDLNVTHCGDLSCSPGNLTTETIDSEGNVGLYTSIAVGSDGFPIVSYFDGTNRDLKVAHCDDLACAGSHVATVDSAGEVGRDTSITVGADGLPVVGYQDSSNEDLKVAHCGNSRCSSGNVLRTIESTGSSGWNISIMIGANGLPALSYHHLTSQDLKLARCGNVTCSAGNELLTLDSAGDVGVFSSIGLATDGVPIVSYLNNGPSAVDPADDSLKVARPPLG